MADLPNIDYATNIALVKEETGKVDNIIWGMFYSADAYSQEGFIAVPVKELAVKIGDSYRDGKFYNQGGEIVITMEEYYENELAEMDSFIIDALYEDIIGDIDI